MNKALIFPIVALVVLFAQRAFNIEWTDKDIQVITDGLLAVSALIGIFMNPKKPE